MATTMERNLQADVDELKSDLSKIRGDLATLTNDLIHQGKTSAQAVRQRVEDEVRSSVESVQHRIEERPVTAALLALGAGVILGFIMRRS